MPRTSAAAASRRHAPAIGSVVLGMLVATGSLVAAPSAVRGADNLPPVPTIAATSLSVDELGDATASGTVIDPELDGVEMTADHGQMFGMGPNPDGSFTWSWTFPAPDGPAVVDVTLTFADPQGGVTTVPLHVDVANAPPAVEIWGPRYVPVGPHLRWFYYDYTDVPTDFVSVEASCGPATYGPVQFFQQVSCTNWVSGANTVTVDATDADGGSTHATRDILGTPAVLPVEDAETLIQGPAEFGGALAILDINGDGRNDLVVGNDGSGTILPSGSGDVAVFLGPIEPGELDLDDAAPPNGFRILRPAASDQFGRSMTNAGDVNGDGIDDLLIGAPTASPLGRTAAGEAWVVYGSRDAAADINLSTAPLADAVAILGADEYDRLGASLGAGGDVNHDGFDDIVVGSPFPAPGVIDVIFGGPSLQTVDTASPGSRGFRINAQDHPASRYHGLAIGRMDGDEYADVVIGGMSRIAIVYGGAALTNLNLAAPPPGQVSTIFERYSGTSGDDLSVRLADVNRDGNLDVVAGRPEVAGQPGFVGMTVIFLGRGDRTNRSADVFGPADAIHIAGNWDAGEAVTVGDFNRDGLFDLGVLGAENIDGRIEASAYRIQPGATLSDIDLGDLDGRWDRIDGRIGWRAMYGAIAAGDLTGDGADELVVGWAPAALVSIHSMTPVADSTAPVGSISIAGGAGYATSNPVSIAVPATDGGSGVDRVALSNDGATWTESPYGAMKTWTLMPGTGPRTVWAKWRDAAGNWSAPKSDSIILDASPPVIGAGTLIAQPSGALAAAGTIPLTLSWKATDVGTGVAKYRLDQSTDGKPWVAISTALTTPSSTRTLTTGHTYAFRIRAVDVAGNASGSRSVGPFTATLLGETTARATYSGAWASVSSSAFTDGKARRTSVLNAKVTYAFTGSAVAWVASRGPTGGSVKVYVDGTYTTTIDLHRSTTLNRQIVFSRTWAVAGPHTLTLVNVASPRHPYANVDGFISFDGLPRGSISARR